MQKKHQHQQSENQLKYSSLNRAEDQDFNIGKFRESVYSKMQQLSNQEIKSTVSRAPKPLPQTETRGSIPSFEDIFKKMTFHNSVSTTNHKRDGSLRYSIQSKIEQFADPPPSRLSQRSVGMTLHISNRFASQTKLEKPQPTVKYSSSFIDKPVIAQPLKQSLVEKLPLKELMDLRNKIEGSTQIEVQQLSKNYVSELTKLALIVNKQMKRCKL